MKSCLFTTAALVSAMAYLSGVSAIEHTSNISTDDFVEDWTEKDTHMQSYENEMIQRYSKQVDNNYRPVIGVLTEPIRGHIKTSDEDYADRRGAQSYVPRAHVQFLEQAGVRVIPIDYSLPID